ncbi:MAG: CHASE2 domain-containing protein, partial [Betaproteobacteria bacterium]
MIAEGAEIGFEHLREADGSHSGLSESLVTVSGLYQRILTAERHPVVRFTAVVEIDPDKDLPGISAANVCAERDFLAHLLTRIDAANPAVIVIDKYFGRTTCTADDPATKALARTVETIRHNRPVLVGLRTRDLAPAAEHGGKASAFIEESLAFGPADLAASQEAIVNIALDNRRLPLQ